MNRRRGFILVLAILFLALLELLAISVALRVPQGVREAARLGDETAAYLVAEAGVQDTVAWLEYQLKQGVDPDLSQRKGKLGQDDWTVDIEPDSATYPNGNHSCRCYKLNATGRRGTVTRRIKVSIVQGSFGRYARFINHWPETTPPEETVYFWAGPIYVNGPVHSNESLWVRSDPDFYAGGTDHNRLFDTNWVSYVTSIVKGPGYPANDAELEMIYSTKNPKKAPRKVNKIETPNLVHLKKLAQGEEEHRVLSTLTLSATGGVYVSQSLDDFELKGNHQIYRVGSKVVDVRQTGETVSWTVDGVASGSFAGQLNGLTYVEGDVRGFHGENVVGNLTLVTDSDPAVSVERYVVLTGNVTCTTGSKLGVITDHLRLPDPTRLARDLSGLGNPPNPVSLDACVYMVGKDGYGGFIVDDMVTSPARLGAITIHGCIIEGKRKVCAVRGPDNGWNIIVDHSKVDRHNPAPFFPAEPKFEVTAIESEQR